MSIAATVVLFGILSVSVFVGVVAVCGYLRYRKFVRSVERVLDEKMGDTLGSDPDADAVANILSRYCGETGKSESAVETLNRIIDERKVLSDGIRDLARYLEDKGVPIAVVGLNIGRRG